MRLFNRGQEVSTTIVGTSSTTNNSISVPSSTTTVPYAPTTSTTSVPTIGGSKTVGPPFGAYTSSYPFVSVNATRLAQEIAQEVFEMRRRGDWPVQIDCGMSAAQLLMEWSVAQSSSSFMYFTSAADHLYQFMGIPLKANLDLPLSFWAVGY